MREKQAMPLNERVSVSGKNQRMKLGEEEEGREELVDRENVGVSRRLRSINIHLGFQFPFFSFRLSTKVSSLGQPSRTSLCCPFKYMPGAYIPHTSTIASPPNRKRQLGGKERHSSEAAVQVKMQAGWFPALSYPSKS